MERAVRLAMRALPTYAGPGGARPQDPYADAPTAIDHGPDERSLEDDDPSGTSWELVPTAISPALVPVEDAPSEDDTAWGTPVYARRPVVPVTAADIPDRPPSPWRSVPPPEGPRRARRRSEGPNEAALVGVAVGVAGLVFAAAGIVILVLAAVFGG